MKTPINQLQALNACKPAIQFASNYPDLESAWLACDNPTWLLWYARRVSGDKESAATRKVVGVCAQIARLAYPIWQEKYPEDTSMLHCLEICDAFAAGQNSISDLREAAAAAYAAAAADAAAYAAAGKYNPAINQQILSIIRTAYPTLPQ